MNQKEQVTARAVRDIQCFAGVLLVGEAIQNMERPGHGLHLRPDASAELRDKKAALNLAWCASRAGLFRSYPTNDLGMVDWQQVYAAGETHRATYLAALN